MRGWESDKWIFCSDSNFVIKPKYVELERGGADGKRVR